MNGREIIKDIMLKLNISNATLANRLGITQATLWDRIDTQPRKNKPRKDIPVSLLSEMVQVMDYKVIIVPSTTRVPKEGYVIGETEESVKVDLDTLLSTEEAPVKPKKKPGHRILLTKE